MQRFLFIILLLAVVGGVVWWIRYAPESPQLSFAHLSEQKPDISPKEIVQSIDTQIAGVIREVSKNGIRIPQVGTANLLNEVKSATLSATVTTTPEELWKTLQEEGAQSVVTSLAQNTSLSVNNLSTNIATEARYQYCVGVVDEYKRNSEKN